MISVIIPAYNAEETIERAIESVLNQSHKNLELIVVDDGSTDGTAEIIKFHADRDSRVRIIQTDNRGQGAARNTGIKAADGKWLTFLDADDEYQTSAFEKIMSAVGDEPVGLVIFGLEFVPNYIYFWPGQLKPLENKIYPGDGERAQGFIDAFYEKRSMQTYSTGNKLYSRETILKNELFFDERSKYGEDARFNFTYFKYAGSVLTMEEQLYRYLVGRPGTASLVTDASNLQSFWDVSDTKMRLFQDYGYTTEQLRSYHENDIKTILHESLKSLVRSDRANGFKQTVKVAQELTKMQLDSYFFNPEIAADKNVRNFQFAVRLKSSFLVAMVTRKVRKQEDSDKLSKRALEIDRAKEFELMGLQGASARKIKRYFFQADYEYFLDQLNPELKRFLLRDRSILLRRLEAATERKFLRRGWIDLRRSSYHDFVAFLEKRTEVVVKHFDRAGMKENQTINLRSMQETPEAFYEKLIGQKYYILEDPLHQHDDIPVFAGEGLTEIRLHTLNLGKKIISVLPHSLNNWAADVKKFPFSAEAEDLALAAAKHFPELHFIAWDVAITPEGPAIVRGSPDPDSLYSLQIQQREAGKRGGMKREYKKILRMFYKSQKG